MFPVTSRYYNIDNVKYETPDGRVSVYLRRRFVPAASNAPALAEHAVTQDERLDNITARYLGDPEQFWRLCDDNNALRPDELTTTIGRRLRIPFPQGGAI